MTKKISCLMLIHNDCFYLEQSIKSVIKYVAEIVIINNASTDRSDEIVKNMIRIDNDAKIKYINLKNYTPKFMAQRLAENSASNEWIMRFDADYIAYEIEIMLIIIIKSNHLIN